LGDLLFLSSAHEDIFVYQNRNFFIPQIIVVNDFYKLSLNSYAAKDTNCVIFLTKKKTTIAIGIISRMKRIKFNPTLFIWPSTWTRLEHAHCLETINTCGTWAKEKVSTRGRKRTLTDSERKRNSSAVSSKWNKCRIYEGGQLDPERDQIYFYLYLCP
jgi:hypothetical protein